jgi:hypothetical protein
MGGGDEAQHGRGKRKVESGKHSTDAVGDTFYTFHFPLSTFRFTNLPVLAVNALQVAVGKEEVDDGVQRRLLASMNHHGGYLKVGGSSAEAATDSAVYITCSWTKTTLHNL